MTNAWVRNSDMRRLSIFPVLLMVITTIGCYPIYGVGYDYDKKSDFAQYRSYDWLPISPEAWMKNSDVKYIEEAVNTQLEAKGRKMSSKNPDFLVSVQVAKDGELRVTDYSLLYGQPVEPGKRVHKEGTLALDFVDAKSRNLIWRGWARAELRQIKAPEKRAQRINSAVEKILGNFPPAPSK